MRIPSPVSTHNASGPCDLRTVISSPFRGWTRRVIRLFLGHLGLRFTAVCLELRDQADAEKDLVAAADTPPANGNAVEYDGFNLHASVVVSADDDLGRERLMRYGARPPLALDRLRRLPGGRIAYRIKNLRDGRAKHRVMTSSMRSCA